MSLSIFPFTFPQKRDIVTIAILGISIFVKTCAHSRDAVTNTGICGVLMKKIAIALFSLSKKWTNTTKLKPNNEIKGLFTSWMPAMKEF